MTTITAALLDVSGIPPVQVTISGLTAGQNVTVQGVHSSGTWLVPGGLFTATSPADVTLIDNRSPLNTPVFWRVVVAGTVVAQTSSDEVSGCLLVPSVEACVIQSLDGMTQVPAEVVDSESWTGAPRMYESDVAGSTLRPMRYDVSGPDEHEVTVETVGVAARAMQSLLATGAPLVLRLEPGACGLLFPLSEVWRVNARSGLRVGLPGAVPGGDLYDWTLSVAPTADPAPSTPLVAVDWTVFNAQMVNLDWSWDQLDAYLASLKTWNATAGIMWSNL